MNILITGTSSGLGFGLAKHYLTRGHKVFGISRSHNNGLDAFSNFVFLSQDLSHFEELKPKVAAFLANEKKIDLVILNAGILNQIKDLYHTTLDEIESVMNINVWANKVLIDLLFRRLEEIPQIVAVSSGASVSGARGWNAYSLSKATLNMLVNLYAKEFTATHFCALAPGLIDSQMQEYIFNLSDTEAFPTIEKLKEVKATRQMPSVDEAVHTVSKAIERARDFESGSFLDVRTMGKTD
ncbi:MAG TPA: SDR family NAD(P)-dependent oxidoreductase [Draconibacterium sp.]|nr:SDR family NAD(P)-dependent oxidoreductase [Draconibacterium sp.]